MPTSDSVAAGEPERSDRVLPVVLARFPGLFADAVTTFTVPVLVYTATGDAGLSGLALVAQWLPRVLLMPIIGLLVDRFDARRQLVICDGVRTVLCLVPLAAPHVVTYVGAACLLMLADSHGTIATENVLATRVAPAAVPSAQSGLQTGTQVSRTSGPAAAGLLLGSVDARGTFAVCAGIFLLGAISTWWAVPTGQAPTSPRVNADDTGGGSATAVLTRLVAGARISLGTPPLRSLLGYAILVNFIGGALLAVLPPLAIGRYHSTESVLGTTVGAAAAASIGAGVLLGVVVRRRPGLRLWPAFVGTLAVAAGGLCVAPTIATFAVAYGIWSIGITVFTVWMRARRLALIPPGDVGRTLGFFVAAMLAAVPLGGLVLAVFGSIAAPQTILRGVVCTTALCGLAVLVRASARRRQRPTVLFVDQEEAES